MDVDVALLFACWCAVQDLNIFPRPQKREEKDKEITFCGISDIFHAFILAALLIEHTKLMN